MRITEISTRRLRLRAVPSFAPVQCSRPRSVFWNSLTKLHTDGGIEGYTMDYGPLGQGRGSA
jgi:hypothetical protein